MQTQLRPLDVEGRTGATDLGHEDVPATAVGAGRRGEDLGRIGGAADHGGPGRVAEQHTGVAVTPTHQPGEKLDADHQDPAAAVPDPGASDLESQDESRAAAPGEIVSGNLAGTEPPLHERGGVGGVNLRRVAGDDDLVDLAGCEPRVGQRGRRGGDRQVAGGLVVRRKSASLDPGPGRDPLVRGVDVLGPLVVGHDTLGHIRAQPDNSDSAPRHCSISPPWRLGV